MKVVSVVGNRPQFIKAAPLVQALRPVCDHVLVHTGQHYDADLSDVFFAELEMPAPDHRIASGPGSHAAQTARMMEGLDPVLAGEAPDLVLVYGDTNSTLAGALVASKTGRALGHIEAGERSFDRAMPEEVNRVVVDALSDLRFCSSSIAVANLEREGAGGGVHLVGDVMVDVAHRFGPIARERTDVLDRFGVVPGGYVIATAHRQFTTLPDSLPALVTVLETVEEPLVLPLHPRTRNALDAAGLLPRAAAAAILTPPLGYLDFMALLISARVCLTDSGGLQKEAYLYRVPLPDDARHQRVEGDDRARLEPPRAPRRRGRPGRPRVRAAGAR